MFELVFCLDFVANVRLIKRNWYVDKSKTKMIDIFIISFNVGQIIDCLNRPSDLSTLKISFPKIFHMPYWVGKNFHIFEGKAPHLQVFHSISLPLFLRRSWFFSPDPNQIYFKKFPELIQLFLRRNWRIKKITVQLAQRNVSFMV